MCKLKHSTIVNNEDDFKNIDSKGLLILTETEKKHDAVAESIYRRRFNAALSKLHQEKLLQLELIQKRRDVFKADNEFFNIQRRQHHDQNPLSMSIPIESSSSSLNTNPIEDDILFTRRDSSNELFVRRDPIPSLSDQLEIKISQHESAIVDLENALSENYVDCSLIESELENAKDARENIQTLFERKINLPSSEQDNKDIQDTHELVQSFQNKLLDIIHRLKITHEKIIDISNLINGHYNKIRSLSIKRMVMRENENLKYQELRTESFHGALAKLKKIICSQNHSLPSTSKASEGLFQTDTVCISSDDDDDDEDTTTTKKPHDEFK